MNIDIKLHKNDLPDDLDLGNVIAVDGEFMGLNVRRDPLCLIQISSGNSDAHIVQLNRSNYKAPNLIKTLEDKIQSLFEKADICINLIGILYEKKRNSFKNIHTLFPSLLAKLSKQNKLKHLIHLSALGISEATESEYARSKLEGEKEILKNFPLSTILRPSVCLLYTSDAADES